jgi:hypothetical protein
MVTVEQWITSRRSRTWRCSIQGISTFWRRWSVDISRGHRGSGRSGREWYIVRCYVNRLRLGCTGSNAHLDLFEHRLLDLLGDLSDKIRIDDSRGV